MKNSKEDKKEKASAPLVERGPDGVAINVVSQARLDKSRTRLDPADENGCNSVFQICRRRWGKVPIWQEPEDLLAAFNMYQDWIDRHPIIAVDVVKSGNMAGTLLEIPRKRLMTETDFCAFLGAAPNYMAVRRQIYEDNYKEFGLEASKAFAEAIDNIRQMIFQDMDAGAAAQVFDPNYIRALRGHKTALDYTTGGKEIKGGLTIQVSDPRTVSRVQKLKEFKKEHKGSENEGKGG